MVLQAELYPSVGPQQGYVRKEEYYKNDSYNSGAMHKEDYYSKNYYSSSPSMHISPNPSIHSPYGSNHHMSGYGGYQSTSGHYGYEQGMYPSHGSMNHGYSSHHGSHMAMGPNRMETSRYEHRHSGSSGPYYQQHNNHSWVSKDLDD